MKYFTEFLQNAYYHCLHYVADKKLHRFERAFWSFWIILSMVTVIFIVQQAVESYYSTTSTLRVRTDFLHFITPFPAIFFCETDEINGKIDTMLKQFNINVTDHRSATKIDYFVQEMTFIRPLSNSFVINICDNMNDEYCRFTMAYRNNLSIFSRYVRASCEEMFSSCSYNGKSFDCCQWFLPINTYEGKCYAMNSFNAIFEYILTNDKRMKKEYFGGETKFRKLFRQKIFGHLPHTLKQKPGENSGNLSIELAHSAVNVWCMGNTNIPTKTYQRDNRLEEEDFQDIATSDVYLDIDEITVDPSISNLGIEQRNCQFWYENASLSAFKIYSNSACEIECIRKAQLKVCGCVVHLLPTQKGLLDPVCDAMGVICTARKMEQINRHLTLGCKCKVNCHLLEISIIGFIPSDDAVQFRNEKSVKRINFIARAPKVQYVRGSYPEPLNYIVFIGGAISLCIGCSVLTIAQILYFFALKPISERFFMKKDFPKHRKSRSFVA